MEPACSEGGGACSSVPGTKRLKGRPVWVPRSRGRPTEPRLWGHRPRSPLPPGPDGRPGARESPAPPPPAPAAATFAVRTRTDGAGSARGRVAPVAGPSGKHGGSAEEGWRLPPFAFPPQPRQNHMTRPRISLVCSPLLGRKSELLLYKFHLMPARPSASGAASPTSACKATLPETRERGKI